MFQQPAVSATHVAFVYAGDIWVVPKTGGVALRLSSPPGEESFPRFSPDGSGIAYTANYDGNESVYVVPTLGGDPVRLTHHPMGDRVVGWHPDGKRVLFASSRESGRQRFSQFYLVPLTGGLPEKLPVPYGEFGAFSADGKRFAYTPQSQDFRTWKRYRGGWAPDIWVFDLASYAAVNVTKSDAVDSHPMWHGTTMYFMLVVTCLADETELRFRAWVEARRARVDEASHGRIGDIYVQSTGTDAQNELVRQFIAQRTKDGLIIDERFNSGGQIPDRFIELLNRPPLSYWAVRDSGSRQWPPVAHRGPKAMLINGWSGSGGDAFPFYFREAGLGPLIGRRTWGGLIGISGAPDLVDGGVVTVPTFRMYDPKGAWFAEGHGVDPDIPVGEDPTALARGTDPQLERAIEEVTKQLASFQLAPKRPAYERRVPDSLTERGRPWPRLRRPRNAERGTRNER